MRRPPKPMGVLALMMAVLGAGCSNAPSETGAEGGAASARAKAVRFAGCMREHGVRAFPDPDGSGELTIDAIANGSSVDTDAPAFTYALRRCKDLEPPGFTGVTRSASEQEHALAFARCMRENGIEDFPDPAKDGPLIDTRRIPSAAGRGALSIPGFTAAQEKCSAAFAGELGLKRP